MKSVIPITLLGQQYVIRADADPEEVQRIAEFVQNKVDEAFRGGAADTLNSIVLALMNLGGAYLRLREEKRREDETVLRLRRLLERLNEALPEPPKA